MIFPDVDVKNWCDKYGIEIDENKCENCGKLIDTYIPYVTSRHVGVLSSKCDCGEEQGSISIFKGRTPESQRNINHCAETLGCP